MVGASEAINTATTAAVFALGPAIAVRKRLVSEMARPLTKQVISADAMPAARKDRSGPEKINAP